MRYYAARKFALTATMFVVWPTMQSCGPSSVVPTAFAGLTVGQAIDNLQEAVESVVAQAGNESRATAIQIAGQLRLLTQELRIAYKDVLTDSFDKLDIQQQSLFLDLGNLIDRFSENMGDSLQGVEASVNELSDTIDRSVLGSEDPRVFDYTPHYRIEQQGSDQIPISVRGKFLNYGDAYMSFGGHRFTPSLNTGKDLSFLVPSETLKANETKLSFKELSVFVGQDPGFWSFWTSAEMQEYRLLVYVLPKQLGHYQVTAIKQVPDIQMKRVKQFFSVISNKRSPKKEIFSISSPAGWKFVDQFWNSTRIDHGSNSAHSVVRVDDHTLSVSITAGNNPRNGRAGKVEGEVVYVLEQEDGRMKTIAMPDVAGGTLSWLDKKAHTLPEGTRYFRVDLDLFNGANRSYVEDTRDRFVTISFDPRDRFLRIAPRSPEKASEGPIEPLEQRAAIKEKDGC